MIYKIKFYLTSYVVVVLENGYTVAYTLLTNCQLNAI